MMTLPASALPVLGDDLHGAGVRHGEHDDIANRYRAERADRGPAAERGSQTLGLGRVTADELDRVAASDRASSRWCWSCRQDR